MKVTIICALVIGMSSMAWGQNKPKTAEELAAYMGADREQILLEGAKKEGKLVWYTSLSGKSRKNVAKAFEKKYPDIKVQIYRAGSKDLAPKLLSEAQAGQHVADTMESSAPILMLLREKNMLIPYTSPALKIYPDEALTKADNGLIYFVNDRESFIGFGYNTKLIAEKDVPKSFDDLLSPALKGKMHMSTSSTGDRVIGMMLKHKGKEFIEKFKQQDVKLSSVSGSAQRDLVIAGEQPASPTLFRNHLMVKIEEGAPIKWVPMDVVPTNAGGAIFIKNAPHPHAALLFIDFLLEKEGGQEELIKLHYGAAWKDYPFKRVFPERGMSVKEYQKEQKGWNRMLRAVGRGR